MVKRIYRNVFVILFGGLWAFYRCIVRPHLSGYCMCQPCCSVYMYQALTTDGILRGLWRGTKRVVKCGGIAYEG